MSPRTGRLLEETAYHESGHAFMATYLGAKVRSVTIDPDRDDGPASMATPRSSGARSRMSDREYLQKAIQVILAGPVAEMLYTGGAYPSGLRGGVGGRLSARLGARGALMPDPATRIGLLEAIYASAPPASRFRAELVRRRRGAADHLLAHETLEAEESARSSEDGSGSSPRSRPGEQDDSVQRRAETSSISACRMIKPRSRRAITARRNRGFQGVPIEFSGASRVGPGCARPPSPRTTRTSAFCGEFTSKSEAIRLHPEVVPPADFGRVLLPSTTTIASPWLGAEAFTGQRGDRPEGSHVTFVEERARSTW